jgi:hypothetical protein
VPPCVELTSVANPFDPHEDYSLAALAAEYQSSREGAAWYCHHCRSWKWIVELVSGPARIPF